MGLKTFWISPSHEHGLCCSACPPSLFCPDLPNTALARPPAFFFPSSGFGLQLGEDGEDLDALANVSESDKGERDEPPSSLQLRPILQPPPVCCCYCFPHFVPVVRLSFVLRTVCQLWALLDCCAHRVPWRVGPP